MYLEILLVFGTAILYLYTVSRLIHFDHSVVKIIFAVIWVGFLLIAKSASRYGSLILILLSQSDMEVPITAFIGV